MRQRMRGRMYPKGTAAEHGKRSLWRWCATVAAAALVTTGLVVAAPPEEAEAAAPGPKDAIAVLFSYTWNKIASECEDTLGPAGYGYVQTSPPQEHAMVAGEGNPWWIYYQPVSYKLESRMGTEAEFKSMVQRCNAAGVGVIVDAVINHMSGQSNGGTGWAGTVFQHYNYPGLYSDSDFHSCKRDIDTYKDRWVVQECNLVNLSDLNTGSSSVQQKIADYLNKLIDIGVKGFRFDAVKHIASADMNGIMSKVKNRDQLYIVQEVIRAAGEPIQPEEYTAYGDVHEFAYARKLKEAFGGSRIDWLITGTGIGSSWEGFLPQANAAVFVDNHDTERNGETLSYKNGASYDLAQYFTLAWNYGSPSIHSGYEFSNDKQAPVVNGQGRVVDPQPGQNGWTFEHAETGIKNMVGFRVTTYGTDIVNKWTSADGSAIGFGRGSKGYVAINNGSSSVQREFTTSLPDGTYYNVIKATKAGNSWSGETITVAGGKFTATLGAKDAIALHVDARAIACTDTGAPTVPSNVKATANGTTITVTWTASTDECSGVSGYQITRTGGTGGSVTLTSTSTQLIDSGLAENTTYSYTVKAKDGAGYTSGASAAASAKTGEKQASTSTTVYYQIPSGWSAAYIHYQVGSGAWTTAPGKQMSAVSGFDGWYQFTVEDASADAITAAFNNGSGTWDSNGSKNYTIAAGGDKSVSGGAVTSGKPEKGDPLSGSLSLYYKPSGWTAAYAHYQVGSGAWTTVPGKQMTAVTTCEAGTGWYHVDIPAASASSVTVAFNNGSGTWDNNGSKNYTFTTATAAVSGGAVSVKDPCATTSSTVPAVPSGLKATVSGTSVALSWSAVSGATKYRVAYRDAGVVKYVTVTSGTTLTVSDLAAGTAYWFKVRAENSAGYSAYSAQVDVTTGSTGVVTVPAVPSGLKATVSGTSVALSWSAVSGATKYRVAYRDAGVAKYVTVTSGTTLTVSGLSAQTAYWFKVRAENSAGYSAYSAQVDVTTGSTGVVTVPAVPSGLKATVSGTSVALSWSAVSGATKYRVAYRDAGVVKYVTVTSGTTLTVSGLSAQTAYWFKVRAENSAGTSAYSTQVDVTTAGTGSTPTPTPTSTPPVTPSTRVGTDHSVALYSTNPSSQVGKAKTITVDGSASEWTSDMIIAQGVANDDPRAFLGTHEGPVYDPYSLSAAWDDTNLYLMWQFTNVTDVIDPAQGYPISDNGKPYNGDIPQAIAFDVNSKGSDGIVAADEKGGWGMRYKFANKEVDHLAMFSSKKGVGQPSIFSLNSEGAFDYKPANVAGFTAAGISFAYGDGFTGSTLMGVKKNGYEGYTPADLTKPSNFTDLLTQGHSKAQDTIYEMKIPLTSLGITRSYLEANGIGVMLISTFGESAIGSLPYDPTTLDNATKPYSADSSTSGEKEDWDSFTARFASVGKN
uniref:Alpha-amylase n=1 Tax=Microbacterium aurum TaxID=36805 RepID=A0A0G2T4B5_9MICO|nr:alpha-amylase [Microbacterium aurum]